jgi:hypothetical protein
MLYPFALADGSSDTPVRAPSRHREFGEIVRLALEPGVYSALAHSLSIAEQEIGYALTRANPPGGELVVSRDEIRNPFNLFRKPPISAPNRLASPPLSVGSSAA